MPDRTDLLVVGAGPYAYAAAACARDHRGPRAEDHTPIPLSLYDRSSASPRAARRRDPGRLRELR